MPENRTKSESGGEKKLAVAWWVDHRRLARENEELAKLKVLEMTVVPISNELLLVNARLLLNLVCVKTDQAKEEANAFQGEL